MKIKNNEKAAKRIQNAVRNNERIVIYADSDLDGVASAIILKETIENLNSRTATFYFPQREEEGYGLNKYALDSLKGLSPALIIVLDCGISNFQEIIIAKKMGFEVVIIDHHQILGKLPKASIVVDPQQKGEKYHFKNFATAGLVFKLCQSMLGERLNGNLRKNFLELVALATISDLMPPLEENKIFIEEGLTSLIRTWRPGLKVLFQVELVENQISLREKAQKIISLLNSAENKNHHNVAFLLLISSDEKEIKIIIGELLENYQKKQTKATEIFEEIKKRIALKPFRPFIFEGDADWPLVLLGRVASQVCSEFEKPTFLFRRKEKESIGAIRAMSGVNVVEIMNSCQEIFETYGGHPTAAGFSMKNENLEKFEEHLTKHFAAVL